MYLNADSLKNKRDEFEAMLYQKDIDIALICESMPKHHTTLAEETLFNIVGYDSIEDKTGRGVAVYFKSTLEIKLLENINCIYSPSLFFRVSNAKDQTNLAIIYRSPNISADQDEKLNKQLSQAFKSLKNLTVYS